MCSRFHMASQARIRFYVRGLGFLSHCGIGDIADAVISSLSQIWFAWHALFLPVSHVHGLIQSTGLSFLSPLPPPTGWKTLPAPSCVMWVWLGTLTLNLLIASISRYRVQQYPNIGICSLLSVSILFLYMETFILYWVRYTFLKKSCFFITFFIWEHSWLTTLS